MFYVIRGSVTSVEERVRRDPVVPLIDRSNARSENTIRDLLISPLIVVCDECNVRHLGHTEIYGGTFRSKWNRYFARYPIFPALHSRIDAKRVFID